MYLNCCRKSITRKMNCARGKYPPLTKSTEIEVT